jgi:hypothetical protein
MNVFRLRDQLVGQYSDYVKSFIQIRDKRISAHVNQRLDEGMLWPEPLIQLNPSFDQGAWIDDLVKEGVLHQECAKIFRKGKKPDNLGEPMRLHRHQEEAATLRSRASVNDAEDEKTADEIGRQTVMDISIEDSAEALDVTPGAESEEEQDDEKARTRRRLLELARMADELRGDKDEKLKKLVTLLKSLIKDGFNPIVFCRFIETSDYVAEELRKSLSKDVEVASITGMLPPSDREQRVADLGSCRSDLLDYERKK